MLVCNESSIIFQQHLCKLGQLVSSSLLDQVLVSCPSLQRCCWKMMLLSLHPNIIVHVENVVSSFPSPPLAHKKYESVAASTKASKLFLWYMYQYSYLVEQVELLLSQFEWDSRDSPTETDSFVIRDSRQFPARAVRPYIHVRGPPGRGPNDDTFTVEGVGLGVKGRSYTSGRSYVRRKPTHILPLCRATKPTFLCLTVSVCVPLHGVLFRGVGK